MEKCIANAIELPETSKQKAFKKATTASAAKLKETVFSLEKAVTQAVRIKKARMQSARTKSAERMRSGFRKTMKIATTKILAAHSCGDLRDDDLLFLVNDLRESVEVVESTAYNTLTPGCALDGFSFRELGHLHYGSPTNPSARKILMAVESGLFEQNFRSKLAAKAARVKRDRKNEEVDRG
ncbi:MAG: hypothetical protein ABSF22_06245 [Bryobacteraceae bacterium]